MQGQPDCTLCAADTARGHHLRLGSAKKPDGLDLCEDLPRNGQKARAAASRRIQADGQLHKIAGNALFQAHGQDESHPAAHSRLQSRNYCAPARVADEHRRLMADGVQGIGPLKMRSPSSRPSATSKMVFPFCQTPFTITTSPGKSLSSGSLPASVVLPGGRTMPRKNRFLEKPSSWPDALQDLLRNVAIGGTGDDDQGSGPQGSLDGRMDRQSLAYQALCSGWSEDELLHSISEDFLIKINPMVKYGKGCPGGSAARAVTER